MRYLNFSFYIKSSKSSVHYTLKDISKWVLSFHQQYLNIIYVIKFTFEKVNVPTHDFPNILHIFQTL